MGNAKDCRAPKGASLEEDLACASSADEQVCHAMTGCLWKGSTEWETMCQPTTKHDDETKLLCSNRDAVDCAGLDDQCQWMGPEQPCKGKDGKLESNRKCAVFKEESTCKVIGESCKWMNLDEWQHPCWSPDMAKRDMCLALHRMDKEVCQERGCLWQNEKADGTPTGEPSPTTEEPSPTTEEPSPTTTQNDTEHFKCKALESFLTGTKKQQKKAKKCKNDKHQKNKRNCLQGYTEDGVKIIPCEWIGKQGGIEGGVHGGIHYAPHLVQH